MKDEHSSTRARVLVGNTLTEAFSCAGCLSPFFRTSAPKRHRPTCIHAAAAAPAAAPAPTATALANWQERRCRRHLATDLRPLLFSPAAPDASTAVGSSDGQKKVQMRRNYYTGPPINRNAGQLLVGATRAGLAGGAGAGESSLDFRSR